ncbi:hypothetical protein Gotur_002358 [Gossypium turneri]
MEIRAGGVENDYFYGHQLRKISGANVTNQLETVMYKGCYKVLNATIHLESVTYKGILHYLKESIIHHLKENLKLFLNFLAAQE